MLAKYLTEEEINQIIETYEKKFLENLKEENILKIINYLLDNKVYYWKDIIIYYLDICAIDYQEFIEKFEKLKKTYGIEEIGENLSLLEI